MRRFSGRISPRDGKQDLSQHKKERGEKNENQNKGVDLFPPTHCQYDSVADRRNQHRDPAKKILSFTDHQFAQHPRKADDQRQSHDRLDRMEKCGGTDSGTIHYRDGHGEHNQKTSEYQRRKRLSAPAETCTVRRIIATANNP